MNALTILLIVVLIIYLIIYQKSFWKYFFALTIPYYLLTQIIFADFKVNTPKKKFFISSWTHPFDSQIYVSMKLDSNNLLTFLSKYNKEHNCTIGLTTFFMKLMGNIFIKYPKLNGNVLFGLFIAKPQIDISWMVSFENGVDTEILTIKNIDKLSLVDLHNKMNEKKDLVNKRLDVNVNRKRYFLSFLPTFLLAPYLRIISYLSTCGANLSWIGLPKYNSGTGVIVNYGHIGISETYLPIPQFTFAPICIGISKLKEKKEKNGNVNKTMKLFFTIDHRYLNKENIVMVTDDVKDVVMNPELLFDIEYFKQGNNDKILL